VFIAKIRDKLIVGLDIMGAYNTTVDLEAPHAMTRARRGAIMMSQSPTAIIPHAGQ
jgi:hypothetical protein